MQPLPDRTSARLKTGILTAFIAAKFVLQYLMINPNYDLHRDEYLHLDQGYHLAWGYLSVPPFTSWISWVINHLGGSVYVVRFFPALFGALTILVVWKTIEALRGNLYALVLGATCILLSVLVRLNFLYQPSSAEVLFWTAVYYFFIQYVTTNRQKWLLYAAIAFGLGVLNKYNIAFLAIGFLPALLLTRQRHIFLVKGFYLAAVLALLIILPNLVWQYTNNFPVLHHMKLLADTQLVHVSRWLFLKEQLLFFFGALPVIVASLYALLFYKPFRRYRVFLWAFVFTIVAFLALKAKGYYAIGLYPVYIAFGAAWFGDALTAGRKRYLKPVFIIVPVAFCIIFYRIGFSIESPKDIIANPFYKDLGLLRWEDGKEHTLPQDMADMLGWSELAKKVDAVWEQLPESSTTLVLCDNYGQAGSINYYSRYKNVKAVSFNADYINWFDLNKPIDNIIRVKEWESGKSELAETALYFEAAYKADSIANPLAREYGTGIFVFSRPKIDVNARLKAEIEQERWH